MSNVNQRAATEYNKKLRSFERGFAKNYIVPMIRDIVRLMTVEAARLTPYNEGTLRGGWIITVNGSGRLPASPDFADIAAMVDRNMRRFTIKQELAIENDVPYAELYEFGGFEPANPEYKEIGGSLALHVAPEFRDLKRGKVLIVDGYNVTAPQGMVSAAMEYAQAAAGSMKPFPVVTL